MLRRRLTARPHGEAGVRRRLAGERDAIDGLRRPVGGVRCGVFGVRSVLVGLRRRVVARSRSLPSQRARASGVRRRVASRRCPVAGARHRFAALRGRLVGVRRRMPALRSPVAGRHLEPFILLVDSAARLAAQLLDGVDTVAARLGDDAAEELSAPTPRSGRCGHRGRANGVWRIASVADNGPCIRLLRLIHWHASLGTPTLLRRHFLGGKIA
jgi:hypothetical protein